MHCYIDVFTERINDDDDDDDDALTVGGAE